jgi:5-methylcytosine-specific restriction endonuclease McrA
MKRSPLKRGRRKPIDRTDPDFIAWKIPHGGYCQCQCGTFSMHLERHHVLPLSTLKQLGRLDVAWDLANSMLLAPVCHARHTNAVRRIPLEMVPEAAVAFVVDVLGEDRSVLFFARFYGCEHRWAA